MAQEIELKLTLPEAARRAFLRHPLLRQAERLAARKLVNVYFDTPDLALHRRGIALRTRRQGRGWLQTVKCAGAVLGGLTFRPEWEQPYAGRFDFAGIDDADVRAELERMRGRAPFEPVFETTFARRAWRLRPARGTTVLLVLDRGWTTAGERREPISEIELELERGDAGALFDIALHLAADLPLVPALLSKAERGYRLRLGETPRPAKAAPSPLRDGQTPLEAFRGIAAACITQFQWNALGAGADDPEFVHQMRVALRRLRSALRTFRPALPAGFEQAAVPPLRQLARTLGEARDWDVLAKEILAPAQQAFAEDERLAALAAAAGRERRRAHAALREALASPGHAATLLDFTARLHRAAEDAEGMPALADFAARRLNRLHNKALALAAAAAEGDPARLHALRIGVKRLRYAVEFFAPLFPARSTRRALVTLTDLQDSLGALNDLARAGPLLMQCMDGDPALREAVALVGGWHGPRHAVLRRLTFQGMRRLRRMKRFWKE
jgi:adenylate cyclase